MVIIDFLYILDNLIIFFDNFLTLQNHNLLLFFLVFQNRFPANRVGIIKGL